MVEKDLIDFRDSLKKQEVVEVRTDVEKKGTSPRIYSYYSDAVLEKLIKWEKCSL